MLCLGTRNQNRRSDIEATSIKLRPSDDVLKRLPCRQPPRAVKKPAAFPLVNFIERVDKDSIARKMQYILKNSVKQTVALPAVRIFS